MEGKKKKLVRTRITRDIASRDETLIIGLLDSSGSMCSHWSMLARFWNTLIEKKKGRGAIETLAFSSEVYPIKGKVSERIHDYGANRTNILRAIKRIEEIANNYPKFKNICIIFISDGEDSDVGFEQNLKKYIKQEKSKKFLTTTNICFISIGIGSEFPTFVAMDLRNMYHNSDPTVPPLFLIKKLAIEEYNEVFDNLESHLNLKSNFQVKPEVWIFPWSKQTSSTVYQNQWFLTDEDTLSIDGNIVEVKDEVIGFEDLLEIVKGWLSVLQLTALTSSVKEEAKVLLQFIKECNPSKESKTKTTFLERLLLRQKRVAEASLHILMKEIEKLADEGFLGKLTQEQAAKRLAIGTKVGKFHEKALKMRSVSVEEFDTLKQNFIKLIETVKLSPESSQEPSLISLQNQKDIFLETDMIQAMKLCDSQFDLVEELPLIGQAILIERTNGSMINPWLINVKSIARHHKVVDTKTIIQSKNELCLSVGSNEKETINAVLPLFGEKDLDLKPFIHSKVYHLMMTFNVMSNADTLFTSAYPALLSKCLIFLLQQSPSSWRENLLDQMMFTLNNFIFDQSYDIKDYLSALIKTPKLAMVTASTVNKLVCEDLSKPLAFLLTLVKHKKLDDQSKIEEILEAIICEAIGRHLFDDREKISKFIEIINIDKIKANFKERALEILNRFTQEEQLLELNIRTEKLLGSTIQSKLEAISSEVDVELSIQLNEANFRPRRLGCLSVNLLEGIFKNLLGKEVEKKNYILFIINALVTNSYERNTTTLDYKTTTEKFLKTVIVDVKRSVCNNLFAEKKNSIFNAFSSFLNKNAAILSQAEANEEEIKLELLKSTLFKMRHLYGQLDLL